MASALSFLVMPGLDPGIHAAPFALSLGIRASGTPWMPGSSPGMTLKEEFEP
jgi:hypothetical protein